MREQDGDRLFWRPALKRGGDVVAPELEAESGDSGRGDGVVPDAGGFDVEGAEGEIGGITAILRGVPLLAFPPPPNHHSVDPSSVAMGGGGAQTQQRRAEGVIMLPLDVMLRHGVHEESVFRQGTEAPGLRDAVFEVATRASDHLLTASSMLENLRRGEDVGHAFENEGQDAFLGREGAGEDRARAGKSSTAKRQLEEVERGFGVLMQAVGTRLWLGRLEKVGFDVFDTSLRG